MRTDADLAIVLADGLSSRTGRPRCTVVGRDQRDFARRRRRRPPVIATQARVALGDHVAHALGTPTVLVLIGERPGLSVADSVGIYLTHRADADDFATGLSDADRNCISNIHPPDGLRVCGRGRRRRRVGDRRARLGRSGVDLRTPRAPRWPHASSTRSSEPPNRPRVSLSPPGSARTAG